MLIEDAVPPSALAAAQQAYERTIERAMEVGHGAAAEFDAPSPTEGPYRFQDPHHPAVMETALVEALSGPKLMEFVDRLYGAQRHCMHGIAAFSMGVRPLPKHPTRLRDPPTGSVAEAHIRCCCRCCCC